MKLNQHTLGAVMPAPSEAFTRAYERALSQIERGETAQRRARPAWRRIGAIALSALLLLATAIGVAEALNLGVIDFLRNIYGPRKVQPLPEANELVQRDLCNETYNGTIVKISEAMYDGGTLRVVYSLTRPEFPNVLTEDDVYDYEGAFHQALWDSGVTVTGGCDFFTIDGVEYTMTGGTSEMTSPGTHPGEVLHFLDIQLQGTGIAPTGKFEVGLKAYKGETNQDQLLRFTMDASNLKGVRMLKAEGPAAQNGATVTVEEARLTPVYVYMRYRVDADAGLSIPEADDRMFDWMSAYPVDKDGNLLVERGEWGPVETPDRQRLQHNAVFVVEYNPIANPPQTLYFAPVTFDGEGNAIADMAKAIELK